MEAFLGKQYKLVSSENFDEYMKGIGVGLVSRKLANTASPVVELTKEGDEYVLTSTTTFKTVVTKFKLNEEMSYETPDGRKVKSTFTLDGTTIKQTQVGADGKTTTVDRIFSSDGVTMILKVDDVTCTRIYKLQ